MEKNVLREELKDEALDGVAGGKKFKVTDWAKAEEKRKADEKKAQEMMNQGNQRAF